MSLGPLNNQYPWDKEDKDDSADLIRTDVEDLEELARSVGLNIPPSPEPVSYMDRLDCIVPKILLFIVFPLLLAGLGYSAYWNKVVHWPTGLWDHPDIATKDYTCSKLTVPTGQSGFYVICAGLNYTKASLSKDDYVAAFNSTGTDVKTKVEMPKYDEECCDDSFHVTSTNTQRITIPYHHMTLRSGDIIDGESWADKGYMEITCTGFKGDHNVWITRRNEVILAQVITVDSAKEPSVSTIWQPDSKSDFVKCHSRG